MRLWARTALVLTACSGGGGGGGCNSDDTDGVTDCNEFPLSTFPDDGATDVYLRTNVDAVVAVPPAAASIRVADAGGTNVAGTSTSELGYISFQVDGAYTPGETYTATLSGWTDNDACDDGTSTFTVGTEVPTPIGDASVLEGRTWQLDLREGRAVFPYNMDAVLADQMEVDLLLGVRDFVAPDLLVRASSTDATRNAQDLESDTTDFTASFADDPYLLVQEDRLRLVIFNDVITAMDLTLTAAWDAANETWTDTALHTLIDTRELVDVVVGGTDPADDAVCELFVGTFNVRCHACPPSDDLFPEGGEFCITMVVDGMTMTEAGYPLEEVLPER